MYWGEAMVNLATSDDLINWVPTVDEKGNLKPVLSPRKGYFDATLTECGPPAIITDKGILLIYNGKNAEDGDKRFPAEYYCGGQALFDLNDPQKLIARLDNPFYGRVSYRLINCFHMYPFCNRKFQYTFQ